MAGVVASYYDVRNEQYPFETRYPPSLQVPEKRHMARPDSEDVLAAAAKQCRQGGVGPDHPMPAGAHFRAQGHVEHRALRDA
eukprot:13105314-Alexandrium_andersonii.AAC.1